MKNGLELNIELIIQEYSDYVYKIVNNIVGTSLSYQDKEEIVADVFYLLWKNQNKIKENLKSYLATIAKNCSYDKLRKTKLIYEYKEELLYEKSSEIVIEDLEIITEKLNKLNEVDRQIFELFYVAGYKIKEIAKITGLSVANIKFRLFTIRKKLKEGVRNEKN